MMGRPVRQVASADADCDEGPVQRLGLSVPYLPSRRIKVGEEVNNCLSVGFPLVLAVPLRVVEERGRAAELATIEN